MNHFSADFDLFIKDCLVIGDGTLHKNMVTSAFREYLPHQYRHAEQISDKEIETALDKWNEKVGGAQVGPNGLYFGIALKHARPVATTVTAAERAKIRKLQLQMYLAECNKNRVKPDKEVLKEAIQLGLVELPSKAEKEQDKGDQAPQQQNLAPTGKIRRKSGRDLFRASLKQHKRQSKRESIFEWGRYKGDFEWEKYKGDFEWSTFEKTDEKQKANSNKKDKSSKEKRKEKQQNSSSKSDKKKHHEKKKNVSS